MDKKHKYDEIDDDDEDDCIEEQPIDETSEVLMHPLEDLYKDIVIRHFDQAEIDKVTEKIIKISHIDSSRPITLVIDTYGGSVDGLASLINTMESVPNDFVTHARGVCCSAGAFVLAAGDYRFIAPNARIMIHEISSGAFGHIKELNTDVKEIQRLNEQWLTFLNKMCGHEQGYLQNLAKERDARDLWLTPEDAVKHGVADMVGNPMIKPVVLYQISLAPAKDYNKSRDRFKKIMNEMKQRDAADKKADAQAKAMMDLISATTTKPTKADPKKRRDIKPKRKRVSKLKPLLIESV